MVLITCVRRICLVVCLFVGTRNRCVNFSGESADHLITSCPWAELAFNGTLNKSFFFLPLALS